MAVPVQVRGGVPHVRFYTGIDDTGSAIAFRGLTNFMEIRNEGADQVWLYFSDVDFLALNENYVPIDPDEIFVGPAETREIWLVTDTGDSTDVRVIVYYTR